MVCDIEYCDKSTVEEKGKQFTFGYLCEAHYDLLDKFLDGVSKDLNMKSRSVQRRLWVEFKMIQEKKNWDAGIISAVDILQECIQIQKFCSSRVLP